MLRFSAYLNIEKKYGKPFTVVIIYLLFFH